MLMAGDSSNRRPTDYMNGRYPFRMLAIRRFVRGSLTLADTGEQLFPLLCAIDVPLTARLAVLLSPEAALALSHHPATGLPGHTLKRRVRERPDS